MRVLTAAHYWLPHVGGVEFEAREQSRRLVARGHDVTVVSSRIGDDRALSYDDGFPVHKVAASNVLEDRVRLPYPLFSPQLFSLTSRLARDADVVVAHTHTFMSTIAAAHAARAHYKPFVLIQNNPFIEYGFPLNLVQRGADATIARYTVGSADPLLAISEFTARYVQRLAPRRVGTGMHLATDVARILRVASGLPSSATGAGGRRGVVADGVTGILVPPDAPDALASAFSTLYRSPARLTEMGLAALERSAGFTWDRSIDTLERVLKEAVAA